jgi:hypothetical protein
MSQERPGLDPELEDDEDPDIGDDEPLLEDDGIPDLEGPLDSKVATGDEQEGIIPPGAEPRGAAVFGTTAAEQLRGESLTERLEDEEPERPPPESEPEPEAGQITEEGDAETDDEPALVADEFGEVPGEEPEEDAVRVVPEGEVPGAIDAPDDDYEDVYDEGQSV